MQRRKFSREYKFEAVRLVRERRAGVAQAARDLDVHESVLFKIIREFRPRADEAREVAKLKAERDILKKGRVLLCKRRDMKFAFIAKHRSI